jgi:hypothetical protein
MPDVNLKKIEKLLEKGFESQGIVINGEFQEQKDHFDSLINDLSSDLGKVKDDLTRIESKLAVPYIQNCST